MKTTQIIASLAVGAALVLAAGQTQAQVLQKLTLSGTQTYQSANTTKVNGDTSITTTFKTKKVSFNNNKIIAFLNASAVFTNAAGGVIPKGSYFVMDDSGNVIVTNKSGFNYSLTSGGFASTDFGSFQVFTGNENNLSTQFKQNGFSVTGSMDINDGAGNEIFFTGMIKFSVNDGKANSSGVYKESLSTQLSGANQGSVVVALPDGSHASVPALSEGKAKASGSGNLSS